MTFTHPRLGVAALREHWDSLSIPPPEPPPHTHERTCAAVPSPAGTCWDGDDQPRIPQRHAYPYALSALLECGKCWAVYPAIFAYPTLDGWRLDTIVAHHASHRLGRCCPDPEEKVA